MGSPQVSRRQLLRGAALGATAAAAGGVVPPGVAQEEMPPVVAGVVERVEPPSTVVLMKAEGPCVVTFTPGATFWKDEPARLEDFVPGDEVVVEGEGTPAAFTGTSMTTTFRLIETEIQERRGLRLHTPEGRIEMIPQTQLLTAHGSKPLEALAKNDRIVAICRVDPSSPSDFIALRIGVDRTRGGS